MKIKHMLLSVFFVFAVNSAMAQTAQDERVLQIPGHENPLKLETLRKRMLEKIRYRFIQDIVIISIKESYNPFVYLASLMSDKKIYYVDLEILMGLKWKRFNDCEIWLKSSTYSRYLIHFKECTKRGEATILPDIFFYRDELGLTG